MTYQFKGKIKEIGIDTNGNFCSFSSDNNIKIDGESYGVAFNGKHDLKMIGTFRNIDLNIFNLLTASQNEKMAIEFDDSNSLPTSNTQIDTNTKEHEVVTSTIIKVTIIK